MTSSVTESRISPDRLAVLVAAAAILQLSESMIPHPFPGMRLGLANIVSLILLFQYGFKPALTVTLLRIVVASFVFGSFLSPGFFLSFFAGLVSIAVLGGLFQVNRKMGRLGLSPVGFGVVGALAHNMTQLALAYVLFFRHGGILVLVPWMVFGSVIIGIVTGSLTLTVLNRLASGVQALPEFAITESRVQEIVLPGNSFLHRCMPEVKIGVLLLVTLLMVLVENVFFYGGLLVGITILVFLSSVPVIQIFSVVKKIWPVLLTTFFLPIFFNYGTREFLQTPFGTLHFEAVESGVIFSLRLVILALLARLIARTTTIDGFTKGLCSFLKPCIGRKSEDIASNIAATLTAFPQVWVEIRSLLQHLVRGKPRNFKTLKEAVVTLFLYLFHRQQKEDS